MGGVQVEVFADQETFEMLGKEIFDFFQRLMSFAKLRLHYSID